MKISSVLICGTFDTIDFVCSACVQSDGCVFRTLRNIGQFSHSVICNV